MTASPATGDFNDGSLWNVWVDYDGTTMEVRFSQDFLRPTAALLSHVVSIETLMGGSEAYVGFVAGTEAKGACGKVFQAVGVALPPTIRQMGPPGDQAATESTTRV